MSTIFWILRALNFVFFRDQGISTHLTNSISYGHVSHGRFTSLLNILGQKLELDVLGVDEPRMALVLGVDIVLDFGHCEFTSRQRGAVDY